MRHILDPFYLAFFDPILESIEQAYLVCSRPISLFLPHRLCFFRIGKLIISDSTPNQMIFFYLRAYLDLGFSITNKQHNQ